jgi:hypothetical protein
MMPSAFASHKICSEVVELVWNLHQDNRNNYVRRNVNVTIENKQIPNALMISFVYIVV